MSRQLDLDDRDYVAVPLTRTELAGLAELYSQMETPNHEEISIELKARGALAKLAEQDARSSA